jgi:hypothetical protein
MNTNYSMVTDFEVDELLPKALVAVTVNDEMSLVENRCAVKD